MFSSSVAGAGSICLGCQLRAVTRRAAPVLAASVVAHTPTTIRRRRYASDSSEPASSNDDFLTSIINEQRYDDGYEASKPKKKKARSTKQRGTPARTSHHEPSPFFSDQEVGFEDVWDQDPELKTGGKTPVKPLGDPNSNLDSARAEQQSDEIDYGASSAEADLYLENYSWNAINAAELQKQYADRKPRRPKKTQPDTQDPPATPISDAPSENPTKTQEVRSDNKSDWRESKLRKSPMKHTDDLYDWGEGHSAASQEQQDNIGLELGENPSTQLQQPRIEAPKERELRHYRKGDTRLVEDLPQLPVETLGQDAPVIVLREQGQWKRRQFREEPRPVDSGLNIQDYADQETGLGLDIILENIDELRPEHRILPAREFKDVFDILMKGFTTVHLASYIERHRQRLAEGDETPFLGVIPDEIIPRPWIVSQSRWIPEVKGAVTDVPHPLKGYILKNMPPKQRLVMHLMRLCWGMSVQELLHGQGMLDLEMRDLEFRLLTLGSQRFLQQVSRVHLGQGGGRSIQVIKSRKAIQIFAPKTVAESCLKMMDEKLQQIRTKSIKMDKLPVKNMSDEMLEELGRITSSLVEINQARQEIDVTWIDTADRYNSKLEDASDVVLRLILSAYPPTRTSKALTVYPDPAEQGRLIEDVGNRDKLPWNDRRMTWARLCLPITTKAKTPQLAKHWPLSEAMLKYKIEPVADDLVEPTSTIDPKKRAFYTSLAGVPLAFPRPPCESEEEQLRQLIQPTKPTLSGWLPFRVRTNAIFGHVLHLNNQHVTASIKEGTDAVSTSRRTVSPLIPPVTGMDLPAWVPYTSPKYMTSLLIMRFTPTSLPSSDGPAPNLELRIKATDEEIIGIDSLRAIAHTHVSDICLPGEHVDVRATQRLVAELPGYHLDTTEGMQPLIQFLKDACLEIGRGRLITPPVLDGLGLPSWMFYAPETDTQSPFLRSRVLAELYDAAKAASKPADGSKPKKASKKAKKPAKLSTPAPAAHSPYTTYANALTPTSYIFSGLEVHRHVETSYDGWKLSYTSVEAGAGGGRRAELELEAVPSGDKDVRREGSRIDAGAWLRSVYKLATGRVAKGKKGDEGAEGVEESEKAISVVKWVADKT
ncbi:hypothetical protein N0V93_009573 [Gnomoniopsis smithogilvyi]|uniref:Uncharacterized protein n=1 Tax=Gnomoniopsis smithogilvyi TaxID=1191159 RepID=A0A9W8YN26_9PEZI|nr:hypothetical protein N0V93_009573 [Gnomoniopsis smithogilvyi]